MSMMVCRFEEQIHTFLASTVERIDSQDGYNVGRCHIEDISSPVVKTFSNATLERR
jgi:hypothetical protein